MRAFSVYGWGLWVLDSKADQIVASGWRQDLDMEVICGPAALSDFVVGRLDNSGGDRDIFAVIREAFSGVQGLARDHARSSAL